MGNALKTKYSGDLKHVSFVSWNNDHVLVVGDKKLSGSGILVQPEFPEMFSLTMLEGNRNALKDPTSLLIAESLAKALFGNANPIDKIVRLDNEQEMKIAGVYADLPQVLPFMVQQYYCPGILRGTG